MYIIYILYYVHYMRERGMRDMGWNGKEGGGSAKKIGG